MTTRIFRRRLAICAAVSRACFRIRMMNRCRRQVSTVRLIRDPTGTASNLISSSRSNRRRCRRAPSRGMNDPDSLRPPGAIGAAPQGAPQSQIAALPPDYQPETGQAKELPPNLKKQMVDYATREPAGTLIIDTGEHVSLSGPRWWKGLALRHRCRPRRIHLERYRADQQNVGMAGLASAVGDDRPATVFAAVHGWRTWQSARSARALSRQDAVSYSRDQSALDHRHVRIVGVHSSDQRGRRGSLQPCAGRHPCRRAAR